LFSASASISSELGVYGHKRELRGVEIVVTDDTKLTPKYSKNLNECIALAQYWAMDRGVL
jgi:hypothetical protein